MPDAFDGVNQTGSCVAIYDFNGDGWEDLFFGSLVVPWNYGLSPQSYLLKNDAGKTFVDVSYYLPNNGILGMINDAEWIDLDGRGNKKLVLAGEWMDVMILSTEGKEFQEHNIPSSSGWWNTIQSVDYDGDGDQDLLMGNLGLNSNLKTKDSQTVNLYLDDFDENGRLDAVVTFHPQGVESIFATRDVLITQIPSIGEKFSSNKAFAQATLEDIFGDKFSNAGKLSVKELRSGIFINEGGSFRFQPFPNVMQISFIQDFLLSDINSDGLQEILSIGNLYATTKHEGRYAADRGSILSRQSGRYQLLSNQDTGLLLKGDNRKIEILNFHGEKLILVTRNNDSIQWLKVDYQQK